MVGVGGAMVRLELPETPPPGAGLETVTRAAPTTAISEAGMAACNWVLETKVVVRELPFHRTEEVETKLVPVRFKVKLGPPAKAEFGFKEARVGIGLSMVNVTAADTPPPGTGLETVTLTVLAVARSAAVMVACNWVPET